MSDDWEESEADKLARIEMEAYDAKIKEEQDAWKAKWPEYCNKCGGSGIVTFLQGHPYGSTTAYEEFAEPCDCILNGFCPRCGATTMNADPDKEVEHQTCSACGWEQDRPDVCPEY